MSPASAVTGLPSKVNVTVFGGRSAHRAVAAMRVIGSQIPRAAAELAGKADAEHLVRARVALGLEPCPAARAVIPPLALDAGDVAAEVVVLVQLAERGLLARTRGDLAAEGEVGHLADAAVRAREHERHSRGIVDNRSVERNTIAYGATIGRVRRRPVASVGQRLGPARGAPRQRGRAGRQRARAPDRRQREHGVAAAGDARIGEGWSRATATGRSGSGSGW